MGMNGKGREGNGQEEAEERKMRQIMRSLHIYVVAFFPPVQMRNMKSLKSRRCTISGTTALQPGSLLLQVRLIRGLRLAMT